MREIVELAKADARAVRAAGERQNEDAAAAMAAEAEAAWAAAGVGSGGSGGDNAMLFLECEVNGRALRAFVDTGAQVRGVGVLMFFMPLAVGPLTMRPRVLFPQDRPQMANRSFLLCNRWLIFFFSSLSILLPAFQPTSFGEGLCFDAPVCDGALLQA
ncbi:unnamed protein product [Ectocarpus fasciculatus]